MTPERLNEIRAELAPLVILKDTTAVQELLDAYTRLLHEVEYLRHENAHLMKLLPKEAFPIYNSRYARERTEGSREGFVDAVERIAEAFPRTEEDGA